MKPFDLNAAIAGAPLQTRDGREVTEFHYFETALKDENNSRAVIENEIYDFNSIGKYYSNSESKNDLFLKSEKKKLYFVVSTISSTNRYQCGNYAFESEEELKKFWPTIDNNWQIVEVEIDI